MATGVYILLGPENGEKDEFLSRLQKAILKKTGEQPEEHRFYPYKLECPNLVAILRNNALFSKHRIVILNEAHEIKKKSDIDILTGYLKHPVDDATLILISDEYRIDRRLSGAVPKGNIKIFWELFENRKQAWIFDYFKKAGFSVEKEAVTLLLELVDNDTRDLKRECDRLILFLEGSEIITADKVEELVYHSKAESVFTLFDQIAGGNFKGSLEVLQSLRLSGAGDPGQILASLTWQFRRLLSVRRLVDRRYGYEDALKQVNIRGKKNGRIYTEACGRYTSADLENILGLVAFHEADFRSGLADLQNFGLELFLYEAVVKRGSPDSSAAVPLQTAIR